MIMIVMMRMRMIRMMMMRMKGEREIRCSFLAAAAFLDLEKAHGARHDITSRHGLVVLDENPVELHPLLAQRDTQLLLELVLEQRHRVPCAQGQRQHLPVQRPLRLVRHMRHLYLERHGAGVRAQILLLAGTVRLLLPFRRGTLWINK